MEKLKASKLNAIAGGLFVLMVIMKIFNVIITTISNIIKANFYTGITFYQIVLSLGFLIVGAGLIVAVYNKKFPIHLVGFGLLTLQALIECFQSFINIFKAIFRGWGIASVIRNIGFTFLAFLTLLAFAAALALVIVNFVAKTEEKKEKLNKLWFVPAALLVVDVIYQLVKFITQFIGWITHFNSHYAYYYPGTYFKAFVMQVLLVVAVGAAMMVVTGKNFKKN